MKTIRTTITGAIRRTLTEEMEANDNIFLLGEDIGDPYGGIHKTTKGLMNKFGTDRVINSPLSEIAIVGVGIGAAMSGMRPVCEIMYADFLPIAMDQIVNNAAKMHFLSRGKASVPLVIRASYGSGKAEGALHSQCPESWFMNFPGLKIVVPSTPRDAQGLLKSSIWDNNPVIFLEHKLLYDLKGEILIENIPIPLGKADIKKAGQDLTLIASSVMVYRSLKAVEELEKDGYSIEVVDIRTLKPFDEDLICKSVKKTGRLLVVEEGPFTGGWGAQVIQTVVEKEFSSLKVAPKRLTAPDVPLPARKDLEDRLIPNVAKIKEQIIKMLN